MKDWWQNLAERERLIAIAGSIVVILAIGYFYIISPFNTTISNLQQQLNDQQQLLAILQDAITRLQHQHTLRQKVAPTQFLSLITINLQQSHLNNFSRQLTQTQDGKVRLSYKKIPFDQFITWLTQLGQNYLIEISQLEVTPLSESGLVTLTIMFKI